ncbi:hypothetical protein [Micrococcus luteus]|uniref:hypothetical protein n=1 Tax=Micrococcus luteus TaxID=1270 RepID=UPI00387A632C
MFEEVNDSGGFANLDFSAAELAVRLHADPLTALGHGLAFSGGTMGATIVALVLLGLLWRARRDATPFVLLPAAMAGSLAITIIGKDRVGR